MYSREITSRNTPRQPVYLRYVWQICSGLRTFSWRLSKRIFACPAPEERVDAGGGGGTQKKTRVPTRGACRTERRHCRPTVCVRRIHSTRCESASSGRQRGQAFLQPKPPSVFLTKRLHWRVRVGITRGSISMAAPPWSEFIKNIFDRQQHISLRKIPIRGWPFRAGYHPTHALQQFQSNRC